MSAESDNMKTNKHTHHSRKEAPTFLFSERSFKTELSEVQLVQIESGQWKGQTGKYCCNCSPEKFNINLGFDAKRKEIKLLADVFLLSEIAFA